MRRYTIFLFVLFCVFSQSFAQGVRKSREGNAKTAAVYISIGKKMFSSPLTRDAGFGAAVGKTQLDAATGGIPLGFDLISTPKVNSCFGCHVSPYGQPAGSGQLVTSVIAAGSQLQIYIPKYAIKHHNPIYSIINSNATTHSFGIGYVEMLSRQITSELQTIRDALKSGKSMELKSKGISFGYISRNKQGSWDTTKIVGLTKAATYTNNGKAPPSLILRPFHQVSSIVSIREFTINAFDFHLGMQAVERFGTDTDPDADGVKNELSVDDITAITLYQATLPVPGRVIPRDHDIEDSVWKGENTFAKIGCTSCHIPSLPLIHQGWIYSEPNPYNPDSSLRPKDVKALIKVDLNSDEWPAPRLKPMKGTVHVPVYTDFKLHDITSGPEDPNHDPLNLHTVFGSEDFFSGTSQFLTARLWGFSNQPPYFHNGRYTTIRDAVLAHDGEARASKLAYKALSLNDQKNVLEFLKTLQILPPTAKHYVVDEEYKPRAWPPGDLLSLSRSHLE